jgi:hypothetical protein
LVLMPRLARYTFEQNSPSLNCAVFCSEYGRIVHSENGYFGHRPKVGLGKSPTQRLIVKSRGFSRGESDSITHIIADNFCVQNLDGANDSGDRFHFLERCFGPLFEWPTIRSKLPLPGASAFELTRSRGGR